MGYGLWLRTKLDKTCQLFDAVNCSQYSIRYVRPTIPDVLISGRLPARRIVTTGGSGDPRARLKLCKPIRFGGGVKIPPSGGLINGSESPRSMLWSARTWLQFVTAPF